MKILYFNYLYDLYGISIGSTIKGVELMKALEQCGHEVKIYWRKDQPNNNGSLKDRSRSYFKSRFAKYLHEPNQLLSNLKYIKQEQKFIKDENPDLIISRLDVYIFSALLLAKLKKIPLLTEVDSPEVYEFRTFHGDYKTHLKLLKYFERKNIVNADECFTVSNKMKQYFVNEGIPPEKLHVITNGADIDRFNPNVNTQTVDEKYKLKDQVVVGFIGSFHYWHGVENLISLIKGTMDSAPNIRFLMVGEGGPMKPKLEQFVRENNFQDRVFLTGHISHEEIPQYVNAMDIVLAPYPKLEFFYYSPVKIYEYLACGKSVVASGIGQIGEIIRDGFNGFLCEPDNLNEMQEKINRLVKDSSLRTKIGENAWQTIVKNHTWKRKGEQLSELCWKVKNEQKN